MRLEVEAVERVLCPVTERVPLEESEEVAVIEPPVKVLKVAVMALIKLEKKLVVVALVMVALVPKKLAEVIEVAEALTSVVCPVTVS